MPSGLALDERFRRRCSWAALLARATALFLLALATSALIWPGLGGGPLYPRRVATAPIFLLPALLYIIALWSLGSVFAGVSKGEAFGSLVAGGLRRVGLALLAGALSSIFGVMLVSRAMTGAGSYVYLDVPGMVLACIGLGLMLLARLLETARAVQAELDEMI